MQALFGEKTFGLWNLSGGSGRFGEHGLVYWGGESYILINEVLSWGGGKGE